MQLTVTRPAPSLHTWSPEFCKRYHTPQTRNERILLRNRCKYLKTLIAGHFTTERVKENVLYPSRQATEKLTHQRMFHPALPLNMSRESKVTRHLREACNMKVRDRNRKGTWKKQIQCRKKKIPVRANL